VNGEQGEVIRYALLGGYLLFVLCPLSSVPSAWFLVLFCPLSSAICRLSSVPVSPFSLRTALCVLHFFFSLDGVQTDGKFLVFRPHYFIQFLKFEMPGEFGKKGIRR
jgi:hypothetical protein